MLPHAHPQDLMSPGISRPRNLRRTAILLTLGISLHNFPEGIATFVTASNNLELGMGVALAVALHNIPEGLAVAGPVYAATGSRSKAVFWAGLSGMAEIFGGVLAWLVLGIRQQLFKGFDAFHPDAFAAFRLFFQHSYFR